MAHQCRDLLPVALLNDFHTWLCANGYEVSDTKAAYSVFNVRVDGKGYEIYVRGRTHAGGETVHASIYGKIIPLAKKFLRDRKGINNA